MVGEKRNVDIRIDIVAASQSRVKSFMDNVQDDVLNGVKGIGENDAG